MANLPFTQVNRPYVASQKQVTGAMQSAYDLIRLRPGITAEVQAAVAAFKAYVAGTSTPNGLKGIPFPSIVNKEYRWEISKLRVALNKAATTVRKSNGLTPYATGAADTFLTGYVPPITVPPVVGGLVEALRLMSYGDSFSQRGVDVTGSPGDRTTGTVNHVLFNFSTPLTSKVGGQTWGIAPMVQMLSNGAVVTPFELCRGVGGSNTGQLNTDNGVVTGTNQDRLSVMRKLVADEKAAGRKLDGLLLFAGTNDAAAGTKTAAASITDLKGMISKLLGDGVPWICMPTIVQRGNDAEPSARVDGTTSDITTDRRPDVDAINAYLISAQAQTDFGGRLLVADPRPAFRNTDPNARANDVNPDMVCDGLHPSPRGCYEIAVRMWDKIRTYLNTQFNPPLATVANPGLLTNGLMAGTAGTITRAGSATINPNFTITGQAPDAWIVRTDDGWASSATDNASGSIVVSKVPTAVGEGTKVVVNVDSTARNNDPGVSMSMRMPLDMTKVQAGDFIEFLSRVDISRVSGLKGITMNLSLAEPDGVTRTYTSHGPALTAFTNMSLPALDRNMILRTQKRQVLSGTYGACTLSIVFHFMQRTAGITLDAVVSQVTERVSNSFSGG